MRFKAKLDFLVHQFISKGMPLSIFHYESKMKRRDLLTIHSAVIAHVWHRMNQMTYDLMPVKIKVDCTLGTTTNGSSKYINIKTLSLRQIRYGKSQMERTHEIPSAWRLTELSLYSERSLRRDSNPRPSDYKSDALPAMLHRRWYAQRLTLHE